MMSTTLMVAAGGTGGGVYPALSVVEAMRRLYGTQVNIQFVGSVGGMERDLVPPGLVDAYHEVQAGPLHGVDPRRTITSLAKLAIGVVQSWRLAGKLRPAALFLTGGWTTFPVAVGCWLRRIPITIFLPDIEPALAIKAISRLARVVTVATGDSAAYFPKGTNLIETGYPLRADLLKATRSDAIAHFGLDPNRRTLLILGGSRGARSINTAIGEILPALLSMDDLQILHVTGNLDWPNVEARQKALSDAERARYHAFAYLHGDMGLALAAADLVVSRAGASSLGELPYFALPSILVPYPFAWRYQKVNADWLVRHGAAIRLDDEKLDTDLLPTIRRLLGDSTTLQAMSSAAKALARANAAEQIAGEVMRLAK